MATAKWISVLLTFLLLTLTNAGDMHRRRMTNNIEDIIGKPDDAEYTAKYWSDNAQKFLNSKLETKLNTNQAKNVIFFLGDGMSVPTLKAARVYKGQKNGKTGEEEILFFESFPYSGLSRTYCVDAQVPDSACTATAYLTGVKANYDTAGVTAAVKLYDCEASRKSENRVDSIARWFQLANKKSGLVTTARVTHATPSAIYAHTAHRNWESDTPEYADETDPMPGECEDIAQQLVRSETGKNLNVIMGGGRRMLIKKGEDPEDPEADGRGDDLNLIEEWEKEKQERGVKSEYIWNKSQLKNIADDTDYLLGIFESDHCVYHLDDPDEDEPTLEEMTEAAIKLLSKDGEGFFLLVEGGRIDHAHHKNLAAKALDETVEMDKAIKKALEITDSDETLIVVTADHSHVFTVNGYPDRGNNILGYAGVDDDDPALDYTTLSYANGPGQREKMTEIGGKDQKYPAFHYLEDETHGGDDVAVFAIGPWAHLFTGSFEQNYIPHAMAFAACVGEGDTVCQRGGSGNLSAFSINFYVMIGFLLWYYYN